MLNISIYDLLDLVKKYDEKDINNIKKAYEYAELLHNGQIRQSGEPYIIHPLNVAYILAEMNADCDTICAGLLHDTLEDTNITKDELEEIFNKDVALLVDGVTKFSRFNFSDKQEQNLANTRKIITGMTDDVRIIFIKLADRLHNMRTLQFKSELKQKENALETLEIFVPLAYYIGTYRIKSELEDLSLFYLKPDTYKAIEEQKLRVEEDNVKCLNEMLENVQNILGEKNINNEIKIRTKNIYGIYQNFYKGNKLSDIHDLLSLKVMVDSVYDCYQTLGLIHTKYHPINDKFKDYICNPKTNMYQSLHTTVFGPEDRIVQTQIRTFDMDYIASFGLAKYWHINQNNAREKMQKELREKFQFFESLNEINEIFSDNKEFLLQIKKEILTNKIYVYTTKGQIIELPEGANVIDFAYKVDCNIANNMVGAVVNDDYVSVDYKLKNKDRVKVIEDNLSFGPRKEWIDQAMTTNAKIKIKEFKK